MSIESGRVPHTDYVNCKAMSKCNMMMQFDRN